MRKHTTYTPDIADTECKLTFEPIEAYDMFNAKIGDKIVVAYLTYDTDYRDIDDMMGDGMGKMYSFHRHAPKGDHNSGLEALGKNSDGEPDIEPIWNDHSDEAIKRYIKLVMRNYSADEIIDRFQEDPASAEERDEIAMDLLYDDCSGVSNYDCVMYDCEMIDVLTEMWSEPAYFPGDKDAQLLACYSHGGEMWSLSGSGMQCRFDTSNSAGVWKPDECLRDQLNSDEAEGKDRGAQARIYCKQFLETFNASNNGEVYGCVVEWFDEDGSSIDHDSCWGFVGSDHAVEALKGDFFDPKCASLAKEYEEEVRTQAGRQLELLGD